MKLSAPCGICGRLTDCNHSWKEIYAEQQSRKRPTRDMIQTELRKRDVMRRPRQSPTYPPPGHS